MERRLTLPEGTATDKIKATFKNGVVEVSVPTAKGMEAKKIPLEADRDISMAAYIQGLPLTASLVTSAMSKQVFSCRADDDIAVAEKIMRDKQVRRLPVVDANNRPTGIISPNDIAREAERQQAARATRQVTDSEIARVMEAVCAPHHRVVAAQSL